MVWQLASVASVAAFWAVSAPAAGELFAAVPCGRPTEVVSLNEALADIWATCVDGTGSDAALAVKPRTLATCSCTFCEAASRS